MGSQLIQLLISIEHQHKYKYFVYLMNCFERNNIIVYSCIQ